MAYEKVSDLSTDNVTKLGGYNEKTKKNNPTSMEGYYLGFRTVQTVNGDAKIHVFQTSKGNVGVWGSKDINDKLCQVKVGTMALAEFTGKKRLQGGKTLNTFTVSQDKSNVLDVANLEAGSSTAPAESYDDSDVNNVDDSTEDEIDEEALQAATAKALAQQAKVQEILNRGKGKKA